MTCTPTHTPPACTAELLLRTGWPAHARASICQQPSLQNMSLPRPGVRWVPASSHPTPGGGHLSQTLSLPLAVASGSGAQDDTAPGHRSGSGGLRLEPKIPTCSHALSGHTPTTGPPLVPTSTRKGSRGDVTLLPPEGPPKPRSQALSQPCGGCPSRSA